MANADLLDIWNDAVANIGAGTAISATTEQSAEAAACARRYKGVVERLVRETDWNCLRRRVALEEVTAGAVWPPGWAYMYQYPADCLAIRGFDVGWAGYRPATAIAYEVGDDSDAGRVIYMNVRDATLVYSAFALDLDEAPHEARFDASMREALGWALAAAIAGSLTGNAQLVANARVEAARTLAEARAANANESAPSSMDTIPPDSLQVRGVVDTPAGSAFGPYWWRSF